MTGRTIVGIPTLVGQYQLHEATSGTDVATVASGVEAALETLPADAELPTPSRGDLRGQDQQKEDAAALADAIARSVPPFDVEPFASEVLVQSLPDAVDFDATEAVLLVDPDGLQWLAPVWLYPDVINPWSYHLSVDVYERAALPAEPADHPYDYEPRTTIDGSTFEDHFVVDEFEQAVIRECHRPLYSALFESNDSNGASATESMVVATEEYLLDILTPLSVMDPNDRDIGMFFEVDDAEELEALQSEADRFRYQAGRELKNARVPSFSVQMKQLLGMTMALIADYHGQVRYGAPAELERVVSAVDPGELRWGLG